MPGRLTSAEYAKSHGAAAGKQLHKERQARTDAINKLAQRVVNTGKGSQSNRVSSSAHRAGRISLGNHPAPKFGPGGFTIGPRGRLKVNNGNFDGSYPGESGDEPGQKYVPTWEELNIEESLRKRKHGQNWNEYLHSQALHPETPKERKKKDLPF
jgi:hypothetical protein